MSPVLETLSALVRINSINPAYQAGASEENLVRYAEDYFRGYGIATDRQEAMPGRHNLIARIPGRKPGRRIVFEAHSDTVGIDGMRIPPFEPTISGGKLYGRGSCDTKAGMAAMMEALVSLKRDGFTPPCEVWVVAAVDEEHTYRGVVKLCEGLSAQAAVVAEPTEMKAVIASKGCLRWRVVVEGKPAHSSKPELGVNAIYQMARVVAALEQDSGNMTGRVHPLVGSPTCSVGLIQGGTQINIIPAECWIEIDRRLIPGERADEVLAHYAGIMDQVKAAIPSMKVHFEKPSVEDIALDTPADSQIARLASAVLSDLGLDGRPVGVPFGSDASKLSRQGIPSIVLGPGSIDLAHTQEEYVECDQVEQAFQFYSQIMRNFE